MDHRPRLRTWLCVLATLLSLSSTLPAFAAESLQRPSTASPLSSKVLLTDSTLAGQRIVAVGTRGHIVYSDDQGKSFSQAAVPTRMLLTAVDFVSDQEGWAVGHDAVILHTSDGGNSWTLQHEDASLEKPLLDVLFLDAQHGIAVGAYGLMLKTSDGGNSWEATEVEEADWHFNALIKIKEGLLIVGEAGKLLRSDDMGETWTALESPYVGSLFGANSVGPDQQILIYGLRGHIYQSNDRGDSWEELKTDLTRNLFDSAELPNGDQVVVGGGGTVLVKSATDSQFKKVPYPGYGNLVSVLPLSDTEVLLFGARGAQPLKVR